MPIETRNQTIRLRVTPREATDIKRQARNAGMKLSEWARYRLLGPTPLRAAVRERLEKKR